jgi:hypothetical protein
MNLRELLVLLLFWICPFVCWESGASAKPAGPKEGPPLLPPVDLNVEGRFPVRVVLKTSGIRLSPVKFVIRKEPMFGTLRLLKQVAGDSVEVEYTPPADLSVREDFFWFAASNGAGFSSDTRAHIRIVDIGPRLQVALALDFPATMVGQSSRLPLEVLNSGDQIAKGRMTVEAPWEIEEGGDGYVLAPGDRKTIGVLFKPAKAGWVQRQVQFVGDASAVVQLRGEALDWVEVARDPFPFAWAGGGKQKAELLLSNPGSGPLDLMLQASPPLEHEAKVRIEAGTTSPVPLRWSGGEVPGGWGTLLISSDTGMRRVVVWSLDAILAGLETPFLLEKQGSVLLSRRTLTNTGGRSGTWTFRCAQPFFLSDAEPATVASPVQLPEAASAAIGPAKKHEEHAAIPGFVWDHNQNRYVPSRAASKAAVEPRMEPREVSSSSLQSSKSPGATVLTRTLRPGENFVLYVGFGGMSAGASGTLFVEGPGGRQEEAIRVREENGRERMKSRGPSSGPALETRPAMMSPGSGFVGGDLPPPPASSPALGVAPVGAVQSGVSSSKKAVPKPPPPPLPKDLKNAFFPGVVYKGARVKDITSSAATLVFPVGPGVEPKHLVVRYREILPGDDGNLVVKWHPFEDSNRRGKRVGDQIEIRLSGLAAGAQNYIDLLGPFVDGGRDKVFEREIVTLPAPHLFSPKRIWPWLTIVVALGGFFISRHRLNRRRFA